MRKCSPLRCNPPAKLCMRLALSILTAGVILLGLPGKGWAGQVPASGAADYFEAQVRPVLVQRCIGCHSGHEPKGGLSLASRAGWQKGGQSGPVIVVGDPDNSLLIKAVRHAPRISAMPPGGQLTDREIAALALWIKQGAVDPRGEPGPAHPLLAGKHWSFLPLKPVAPPLVKNSTWVRTPLDRFVLAQLETRGLRPNPPADRRTLIRRATYDLLGLPPTPAEIAGFLADSSPNAYEKLIDRLLSSPRYGERWGRHWLDLVHYGDTHGYDKDKRRDNAWPYRDYVIAAFNQDKPYARFIKEQIAGDVLFPQSPEATVATGFLAAGPWDFVGNLELAEGTVEKDKTRLIDRDDMVATVMSTFTSTTVHCARCHDHKFDPIPQKDYYRLQAVFAGVERGDRPYSDAALMRRQIALQTRRVSLIVRRDALRVKINAIATPELTRLGAQLDADKKQLAVLPLPTVGAVSPTNGYHSAIASMPDVTKWVQVDLGGALPIEEVRLLPARPTDFPDTPGFGFPVRFRVAASNDPDFQNSVLIADQSQEDFPNPGDTRVRLHVPATSARYVRVTAERLWKRTNDYVFALAEMQIFSHGVNVAPGRPVSALDSIEGGRWGMRHLVDNFDSRNALPEPSDPAVALRTALEDRIAAGELARTRERDAQTDAVTRATLARIETQLTGIARELRTLRSTGMVYAVTPRAPRPIFLLARGDVEQKKEQVSPGALSCVPGLDADFHVTGLSEEGKGRAALAEWIANPQNILTWRSIVNRVWQYHFGHGIVETSSDFGRNGARPTHPELLDWMARWFLQNGQSFKKLHRLILLSAVYRQSSQNRADGARIDSDNHLLWRMNRRRLEAEEIRDSVLAASGKLDLRAGGPGFELFRFKDDHSPVYDYSGTDKVDDPRTFRRAVYEFSVRSVPDPFLESLDKPDPNSLTPVRNTTLTALQALTLRNDPFMVRQSAFFADRLRRYNAAPDRQINLAYQLLFGRDPSLRERGLLTAYAHRYGLDNACRLLFNMNAFVFID